MVKDMPDNVLGLQGLDLVPVLNKIDMPSADPDAATAQMASAFDVEPTGQLAWHGYAHFVPAFMELSGIVVCLQLH